MSITTDIRNAAKSEMLDKMRKRQEDTPQGLFAAMMLQDGPITDEQKAKAKAFEEKPDLTSYLGRERIPEVLLPFSDVYHELTDQEPTKRVFSDWVSTFWEWKDERLSVDDIRMAYSESRDRFTVGRPGALTVTAVGCKSKAKPTVAYRNHAEVERTQEHIEKAVEIEKKAVPMPEAERERMRQWKARIQK